MDLDPIGGVFEEVGKLLFGNVFDGPAKEDIVEEIEEDNDDDSTETYEPKSDATPVEPKHERVTFRHIFTVAEPKPKRVSKPPTGATGVADSETGEGEAPGE